MKTSSFESQVVRLADSVNKKRRQELFSVYESTSLLRALDHIRQQHIYDKGNKSKTMRKIASMPYIVDQFFTKIYGEDYYKDPDFFKKYAEEWLVVDVNKL